MGKQTPLYQCHIDAGAKIVDFAGWDMPLNYGSQIAEHEAVRSAAGMFDVSHMTVVDVSGEAARGYLRYLLANDIDKLKLVGKALYSCMLNEDGGVVDDLIVYYLGDNFYRVVINSATREKDLGWIELQAAEFTGLRIKPRDDVAMLAVQGPRAREIASAQFSASQRPVIDRLLRFQAADLDDYMVARTGYTGEDGFEILAPADAVAKLWRDLLEAGVAPCGLGARDTLRLEAGMNLYGTDMDETTSPLESGLGWTLSLTEDREFVGKTALIEQRHNGVKREMVGLLLLDKGVLRGHMRVVTAGGDGETTSGSFSPTLGRSIAMARVPAGSSGQVEVEMRNKLLQARIVKLPFVREGKSMLTELGDNDE